MTQSSKPSSVGRPRSQARHDLPDNLIPRQRTVAGRVIVYWYWRDPRDGKEKPLQCPDDRVTAIRRAKELNALVARARADNIVESIVSLPPRQRPGVPFNVWINTYMTRIIQRRDLATNTLKSRKSLLNKAADHFKDRPLHELAEDVAAFTAFFEGLENQGKHRSALALRSALVGVFAEAHATGALAATLPNPAELTVAPRVDVKRARLTIDDYQTIWPHCEATGQRIGAWHPNSVLLAMVTAQRREDISTFQFKRGRDWEAAWIAHQRGEKYPIKPYPFVEDDLLWIVQQKTGNLVRIPLSLRLNVIGLSVGEVIDRCRSSVASRYMLHHTIPFGNATIGSSPHLDTITRQFAASRDKTDLKWEGKTPPTYHELRSLAERLYSEQGIDTQTLLGHKTARMTAVYHDTRGADWATVKV